jgi:hypothetical protein
MGKSSVSSGRVLILFALGSGILGGTAAIQSFIKATPEFTYINILLLTAPLSIAAAIIIGSYISDRTEGINLYVCCVIIAVGALVGIVLNLPGSNELSKALLPKTTCSFGGCTTTGGASGGAPGFAFDALKTYWRVYGPADFALGIAAGWLLAALFAGKIRLESL